MEANGHHGRYEQPEIDRHRQALAVQLRKPLDFTLSEPRSIAVIFVHGINTNEIGYSWGLRDKVTKRLGEWARYVEWREVLWAQTIRDNQNNYLVTSSSLGALKNEDWFGFREAARRFVVGGLSDAAAYQKAERGKTDAYYTIQREVVGAIESAANGREPNRLLVFVGHSFGCHIISTFIWDTAKLCRAILDGTAGEKEIRRLDVFLHDNPGQDTPSQNIRHYALKFGLLQTLAGVITFGNNMPLFTFKLPPDDVEPTPFPGSDLPHDIIPQWINFLDYKDILGFPLRTLNRRYEKMVAADVVLRKPKLFSRPVVGHHTGYWEHPTISYALTQMLLHLIHPQSTLPIAGKLRPPLLNALRPGLGPALGDPIPMTDMERDQWQKRSRTRLLGPNENPWPIYGARIQDGGSDSPPNV